MKPVSTLIEPALLLFPLISFNLYLTGKKPGKIVIFTK